MFFEKEKLKDFVKNLDLDDMEITITKVIVQKKMALDHLFTLST